MKKLKEHNKSGITLIALIITIIVLLILAGVTISLVIGEDGILARSIESKKETAKADAEERVWLEVSGSYDETGKINLAELNSNLRNNLEGVKLKVGEKDYVELNEENQITELPATVQYKGYDVEITGKISNLDDSEEEPTTPPTPPKEEKIIEIPRKEDGSLDDTRTFELGGITWQYYYTEGDKAYFICSNYLENSFIPTTGTNITVDGRKVYSSTNRDDLISFLRDTAKWSNIATLVYNALTEKEIEVNQSDIVATGSPTVQQLEKAYNERYGETEDRLEITGDESNGFGYKIGSESSDDYIAVSSKDVYGNKVFFPETSGTSDDLWGNWLASPSAETSSRMCSVFCNGFFCDVYSYKRYGVRPVVSIPLSVIE